MSEVERFPTLTESGRQMLAFLREHPRAPHFRNQSGPRLTPAEVAEMHAWETEVRAAEVGWKPGKPPPWLADFVRQCLADVPHYRRFDPAPFVELPTTSRADLSRDVAQFVPDSISLERLMHFQTSGTTGHRLLIPSHPRVAARYLAFHQRALRRFGVELRHGPGDVGVALLGWQRKCFTYASVTPARGDSGLVKLNLHPDDWRDPGDRGPYLEALAAEVLTGDPISFSALLEIPAELHPRALLSTSMALSAGLRARLESRFQCPVLDLYSMNEAGPLAVADPRAGGHVLLQHRMYVEILDAQGRPLAPGEVGEVTLTGGFNFCLPLLRYRTGDFASLSFEGAEPVLVNLQGRPPVRFRTLAGAWINNLEVTHAFAPLALTQFALHQEADGALHLRWCGEDALTEIEKALRALFGDAQAMRLERGPLWERKVVQYTSALEGAEL